jgi:hypothetical protein
MILDPQYCVCPRECRKILARIGHLIRWVCVLCQREYTCHEEAFYRDRDGS